MRLVLVAVCRQMRRFLLLLCVGNGVLLFALQTNAHSGAIPKSFSSSESQLHRGACLGTFFMVVIDDE